MKHILAVSNETYRGVTLWKTPYGLAFWLGVTLFCPEDMEHARAFIDEWYRQKEN
jgi:hypothetical protein